MVGWFVWGCSWGLEGDVVVGVLRGVRRGVRPGPSYRGGTLGRRVPVRTCGTLGRPGVWTARLGAEFLLFGWFPDFGSGEASGGVPAFGRHAAQRPGGF